MIPPNLEAFRALMERAAKFMHDEEWKDEHMDDSRALTELATATPAQLCGIVGEVEPAAFREGRFFVVTPREGEG